MEHLGANVTSRMSYGTVRGGGAATGPRCCLDWRSRNGFRRGRLREHLFILSRRQSCRFTRILRQKTAVPGTHLTSSAPQTVCCAHDALPSSSGGDNLGSAAEASADVAAAGALAAQTFSGSPLDATVSPTDILGGAAGGQLTWEQDMERQVLQQVELEADITREWRRRGLQLLPRSKGSELAPLPGADMDFSDFMELLEQKRVQFLEYGDYGRHMAVVLPHSVEIPAESAAESADSQEGTAEAAASTQNSATQSSSNLDEALEQQMVWLRHKVRQVPADAHNVVWGTLRGQVAEVSIVNRQNSLGSLVCPTLGLAATWLVRLALAIVLYMLVDKYMLPIWKPMKLEDRPRSTERKLRQALDPALGSLGQSRARFISAEERTGVTFDDFAGQEYVKRELQEVVKILKEAKEFEELGVYCPKGVLLFGPPGTGKTLLARAIAGEAGVPFFSVGGSEFVEMFAGVASSRVKDLFTRARMFAPSIIFIDEIDAIGTKRGTSGSLDGGSIEREQGLIQILTELDGFQESEAKVLVIGATNRIDMLDPALLRKGRFDKVLRVGLPSEAGRYAILQVHAKNKAFNSEEEKEALLKEVAKLTKDFSGAELMNVLNEAAILAIRKDKDEIERGELLQALDRQAGEFKTGEEDVLESPEVQLRTAYREAAIAVLACALPDPGRPILRTSLDELDPLPNMEYVNTRHRVFSKKRDMVNALVRSFAAPAMERQAFGAKGMSWQTGATFRQSVQIADFIILRSGMSALGKVTYETEKDLMKHLVPKVLALRDEYLRFATQKCEAILKEHRQAADTIAEHLLVHGEISGEEIHRIFDSSPRAKDVPSVREIDEHGVLMRMGRWGIHGLSLPGRATFSPGNSGYATFGAPRPRQVKTIGDGTWQMMDKMIQDRIRELKTANEEEQAEHSAQVDLLQPEFL